MQSVNSSERYTCNEERWQLNKMYSSHLAHTGTTSSTTRERQLLPLWLITDHSSLLQIEEESAAFNALIYTRSKMMLLSYCSVWTADRIFAETVMHLESQNY